MNFARLMMAESPSRCSRPNIGRGCDRRKGHDLRPSVGQGCDRRKDHGLRPSVGRGCDCRKDHRVSRIRCVYSWCCARVVGKDQAPCGHLMIATVLFIPSLIWSWDDCVMSEVGKWCMWWLRCKPSRISGAYSVIMLHDSVVGLICSCGVSCIMFMLVMPCYSDDLMIIPV